jgi:hypothetical protein
MANVNQLHVLFSMTKLELAGACTCRIAFYALNNFAKVLFKKVRLRIRLNHHKICDDHIETVSIACACAILPIKMCVSQTFAKILKSSYRSHLQRTLSPLLGPS